MFALFKVNINIRFSASSLCNDISSCFVNASSSLALLRLGYGQDDSSPSPSPSRFTAYML